jgi:FMN phosphatase YigB (HAD superfamily)
MHQDELKSYEAVLFDFDGVLCHDRFYDLSLRPGYGELCDWISEHVFRKPDDEDLIRRWMRGKIGYKDINRIIADARRVESAWLDLELLESVRLMKLDERMLGLAREQKTAGKKIGIVTDNMDVFSLITVPDKKLASVFDFIANSSDHGCLKCDEGGRLFDVALAGLGITAEKAVLLDDSAGSIEAFQRKGGNGMLVS